MHSFIPNLQINYSLSFYVYENHTVIEASIENVLPSLKYRSAVW